MSPELSITSQGELDVKTSQTPKSAHAQNAVVLTYPHTHTPEYFKSHIKMTYNAKFNLEVWE